MSKDNKKAKKTNAMRILDQHGVSYLTHDYESTGAISGVEVAAALGQDPSMTFKTLVAEGASKESKDGGAERTREHYVFVVPVAAELDLKKAAAAVGEKNIAMIRQKELLPLTGYVHGGCSPLGMKKQFRTVIDSSAAEKETIMFSAGKIGLQIETAPAELAKALDFEFAEIV
ncbi:MAG: Cys-tRNA(Pro) deacylase [Clostridia bacterium]|nr:Cys-tRNA(Pro) deacylase [Clostridia bacterium]